MPVKEGTSITLEVAVDLERDVQCSGDRAAIFLAMLAADGRVKEPQAGSVFLKGQPPGHAGVGRGFSQHHPGSLLERRKHPHDT